MNVIPTLLGACVFVAVLYRMWTGHARRWHILAAEYSGGPVDAIGDALQLQSVILTGSGIAFSSYRGIVTIANDGNGLWLKLLPPFSAFHPPLFLPYSELQIKASSWYLNNSSYKLMLPRVGDIGIIIDGDLANWLIARAPQSCQSWYSVHESGDLDFAEA